MSNEPTQLQKAIVIAKKDGWVEKTTWDDWFVRDYHNLNSKVLVHYYTTDLNYLMPIAVKVYDEIEIYDGDILRNEILKLKKDENGTYQDLFNACYEAVKFLTNE